MREVIIKVLDREEIDAETKFSETENVYKVEFPSMYQNMGELVRCKDCKHRPTITINGEYENNGFDLEFPDYKCPCQCEDGYYSWMPKDDWFCGNGERKKDD